MQEASTSLDEKISNTVETIQANAVNDDGATSNHSHNDTNGLNKANKEETNDAQRNLQNMKST